MYDYDQLLARQKRYDELMRQYGSECLSPFSQEMLDLHKTVVAIMDAEEKSHE